MKKIGLPVLFLILIGSMTSALDLADYNIDAVADPPTVAGSKMLNAESYVENNVLNIGFEETCLGPQIFYGAVYEFSEGKFNLLSEKSIPVGKCGSALAIEVTFQAVTYGLM